MNDVTISKFKISEKDKYNEYIKLHKDFNIKDEYLDQLVEYEILKNPAIYFGLAKDKKQYEEKILKGLNNKLFSMGSWVLYNKTKDIFHILDKNNYLDFRTYRNRDLITKKEQLDLFNKKILFVGMSVGSQVVLSFVRTGIGNQITIVDADKVELHNLNRTNFLLQDVGYKKVEIVGRQILSIDPYINLKVVDQYLGDNNIEQLANRNDLIVDSFDNFAIKLKLRKVAKRLKIPVISGFDISKGAMVVVERYDLDNKLDLKFYLNSNTEKDVLSMKAAKPEDRTKLFINIIGKEYHDKRMLSSVLRVGKELTGYPQLAIATNLASSMWTIAAINTLLKKTSKSVRFYVNLEKEIYANL